MLFPQRFLAASRRKLWEGLSRHRSDHRIFPPTQFHYPKTGNGEDVANQVRRLGGAERRGIERRFKKVANGFDLGGCGTGVGLLNGG